MSSPALQSLLHGSSDPLPRGEEVVKLMASHYEVAKGLGEAPASPTTTGPLSESSDSTPPSPKLLGVGALPVGLEVGAPAAGREGCGCVDQEQRVVAAPKAVPDCGPKPVRLRKIYGRLPKFSPFVGNFQHAPSAGNRSRSAFFERHLISEEDHERQKRIKTNPYTGTFHFFPGRYSTLHGLRRFRHHPPFHSSFDELDRLADMSRLVTERVRRAGNPSLAAVFMNGVFSSSSAVYARASVFPVRSCAFTAMQPEVIQSAGQRYRYGGNVDTSRKYGLSLDDCSIMNKASAGYREILYRWNGFRLHHLRKHPHQQPGPGAAMHHARFHMRSRSLSLALERGGGSSSGIFTSSMHMSTTVGPGTMSRNGSVNSGGVLSPSTMFIEGPDGSLPPLDQSARQRPRSPPQRKLQLARTCGSNPGDGHFRGEDGERRGKVRRTSSVSLQLQRPISPPCPMSVGGGAHQQHPATEEGGRAMGANAAGACARGMPLVVQHRKISDTYDVMKDAVLGEGSFAAVYVAYHKEDGREVAVKAIKRRYLFTEEEKASVTNEIDHMFRVAGHRNIIRLYETFETAEHVYLVIEKSTHGNLEQILQLRRKVTELEAMWVVKQLLDAVEYLHCCGVLHCDIKPHNILFSDVEGAFLRDSNKGVGGGAAGGAAGKRLWMYTSPLGMVLKLCDFGLSRKVPDVKYFKHTGDIHKVPFSRITGTTGFIAPELMKKQPYGKPADLWSVGVVLAKMLSGSMPFSPPHRCLESEVSFRGRVWDNISDEAKVFVRGLLENDTCRRLTAKQALGQRWLQPVPEWQPPNLIVRCGPPVPLPKRGAGPSSRRSATVGHADAAAVLLGEGRGKEDGEGEQA